MGCPVLWAYLLHLEHCRTAGNTATVKPLEPSGYCGHLPGLCGSKCPFLAGSLLTASAWRVQLWAPLQTGWGRWMKLYPSGTHAWNQLSCQLRRCLALQFSRMLCLLLAPRCAYVRLGTCCHVCWTWGAAWASEQHEVCVQKLCCSRQTATCSMLGWRYAGLWKCRMRHGTFGYKGCGCWLQLAPP
jgi:hypothetical protein